MICPGNFSAVRSRTIRARPSPIRLARTGNVFIGSSDSETRRNHEWELSLNRCGPERGIHSAAAPTRHQKRNKFRAPGFKVPMQAQKRKEALISIVDISEPPHVGSYEKQRRSVVPIQAQWRKVVAR